MDVEIVNLLKVGKKLEAIKKCQEIGGLTFQEAKAYVEEIERSIPILEEQKPSESSKDLLIKELITLVSTGKKLEAIKKAQDSNGMPFNEAKLYIEGLIKESKPESKEVKINSKDSSNLFTCDVCGKDFNKSLVTTIETNTGVKKVCSTECENIAKNRTQTKSKMPLWQKVAVAIFVVILMKGCSYVTHGGENYGLTHQFFCKIGDTLIPWPTSYSGGFNDYSSTYESESTSDVQVELFTVKGAVLDALDAAPLPGATVFVEGHEDEYSTVTDSEGEFELSIPKNSTDFIIVRFVDREDDKIQISEAVRLLNDGIVSQIPFVLKVSEGIEENTYDNDDD